MEKKYIAIMVLVAFVKNTYAQDAAWKDALKESLLSNTQYFLKIINNAESGDQQNEFRELFNTEQQWYFKTLENATEQKDSSISTLQKHIKKLQDVQAIHASCEAKIIEKLRAGLLKPINLATLRLMLLYETAAVLGTNQFNGDLENTIITNVLKELLMPYITQANLNISLPPNTQEIQVLEGKNRSLAQTITLLQTTVQDIQKIADGASLSLHNLTIKHEELRSKYALNQNIADQRAYEDKIAYNHLQVSTQQKTDHLNNAIAQEQSLRTLLEQELEVRKKMQ